MESLEELVGKTIKSVRRYQFHPEMEAEDTFDDPNALELGFTDETFLRLSATFPDSTVDITPGRIGEPYPSDLPVK